MKILTLTLLLSISTAQAEAIDSSKFPAGFDLAAAIGGEYGNSLGDKAEVKVTAEEQSDLFAPKKYFLEMSVERDGEIEAALDESNFAAVSEDGSVNLLGGTDCDDPGCTSREFSFSFKKKKDGAYYLTGEINLHTEVNEDVEAWFEGDIADLSEKDVQEYCRQSFGKDAQGYYDGYAFCEYTKKFQLKKLK